MLRDVPIYGEIPATTIFATQDRAFPYPAQIAMAAILKGQGIKIDEHTVESGHYPTLSMPKAIADICFRYC
jgi:hypothetical protein